MSGFEIERVYPHPRARVWRALADPELMARWLMPNDFLPEVGHRFTFRTEPGPGFDGVVQCVVTAVEPEELLAFTWKGGPIDTVIKFELDEHEVGSRLTVTQSGFTGLKAWLVSRILLIGSRTIYGRRLPAVLDELAGIERTREDGPACMNPSQNVLVRLLALVERK